MWSEITFTHTKIFSCFVLINSYSSFWRAFHVDSPTIPSALSFLAFWNVFTFVKISKRNTLYCNPNERTGEIKRNVVNKRIITRGFFINHFFKAGGSLSRRCQMLCYWMPYSSSSTIILLCSPPSKPYFAFQELSIIQSFCLVLSYSEVKLPTGQSTSRQEHGLQYLRCVSTVWPPC